TWMYLTKGAPRALIDAFSVTTEAEMKDLQAQKLGIFLLSGLRGRKKSGKVCAVLSSRQAHQAYSKPYS
uniref:hypothetical protein n=1 Tax=Methylophaga sp. TaxID=2024840 RepID=UPI003F6FF32C